MAGRAAQQAMMARRYGLAESVQETPAPAEVSAPAPEPESPAAEPSQAGFADEVAAATVDRVMEHVEAGEWDAAEVYVAEEDGKGRTTLLAALEAFSEAQD